MLKRDRLEYEFLPAALEIAETPPRPLAGMVLWSIILLVIIAIAWSWVGRVDEVAVARGRTTTEVNAKNIQAAQSGVVSDISVKEGQSVKKGDVIIKLDTAQMEKSLMVAKENLEYARVERDAYDATARFLGADDIIYGSSLSGPQKDMLSRSIRDRLAYMRTKSAVLSTTIKQYQTQLSNELNKPEPKDTLFQDQVGARQDKIAQLRSSLDIANANYSSTQAEARAAFSSLAAQASSRMGQLQDIVQRTEQSVREMTIKSPVDGKIQILSVKTLGGVLTSAQLVATIIPDGSKLIVEASLSNKDRGFVRIGQEVAVKVETFPFQRYGKLKGKLTYISPDAINDEKQGLIYKTLIELETARMDIDGNNVELISGMNVSAEIKTGERRIASFLLEPLVKYLDESVTVR